MGKAINWKSAYTCIQCVMPNQEILKQNLIPSVFILINAPGMLQFTVPEYGSWDKILANARNFGVKGQIILIYGHLFSHKSKSIY